MTQSIIDIGDAPNDGTGDPVREAFNKCNNNFTELYAGAGSGTSVATPPQGRLTLQTLTPVMTTTQSAKTMLYYSPYCGNQIGLYDGSAMVPTTFTELSVATTDTTKNPAAVGASQVLDWFIWSDAGTLRLSHGPAWSSDTARSAGTALVMVNGILLNNAAITSGPAASRGTYVGTTRSNASSQLDWIFGTEAGVAGMLCVWNCYNRVTVSSQMTDSTSSWSYNGGTRAANGSTTNRHSAVFGLAEDIIIADLRVPALGAAGTAGAVSIGLNSTTTLSGSVGGISNANRSNAVARYDSTQLGFHFWQWLEFSIGAVTFYGNDTGAFPEKSGLTFTARM